MTGDDDLAERSVEAPEPVLDDPVWEAIWARVPAAWRQGGYRLDRAPHNEVFVRNTMYLRSSKVYDFKPAASERMGQEVAWWLWTVWHEGTRKVDPAMLRWWQRAIDTLSQTRSTFTARPASVTDFPPGVVTREALNQFWQRHGRLPSPGNTRNLESVAYGIHELLTIRCSEHPWWCADTWDLRLDDRIPRRVHEPAADLPIRLAAIDPPWLRDGVRFWLSRSLATETYTWSSIRSRASRMSTYLGRYLTIRGVDHPAIAIGKDQEVELRALFIDFLAWLRSPAATTKGNPMSVTGVAAAQSTVQTFYAFMFDNAAEAAAATGDPRWAELTANHTRLWSPRDRVRRRRGARELSWISTADITRMLTYLDVLAAPTTQTVTVTPIGTGARTVTYQGLGDPAAARVWLLQALTGRRASEILMLDYQPLTMLPGMEGNADDSAYVARLRYQQTKIDGIDPTILVEQAVVNVIAEQHAWLAEMSPEMPQPEHLFLNPRGNFKGLRPRSYRSYQDALKRLDKVAALTDADGRPLRFTQTHRLRHARATELLNAGVPIHVVQRYLGHKSPTMTMQYAATLAQTAEAEFLRYKKVGADGRDLAIAPRDLLDLAHLDRRTDRILPNGLCLLPPTQTCDKGNACLPCGSFATDASHLPDHQTQLDRIVALVNVRTEQFRTKFGTDMPADNIWLAGRRREIASLTAIIDRLSEADAQADATVTGPGTGAAEVAITVVTDGAHAAALHAQVRARLTPPTTPGTRGPR